MYVGVADAACAHLYEHLIGSGLRLWNVFYLPRTIHGGNDCSFHDTPLLTHSMQVALCLVRRFVSPTAGRTHKLRLTVRWQVGGDPEIILMRIVRISTGKRGL